MSALVGNRNVLGPYVGLHRTMVHYRRRAYREESWASCRCGWTENPASGTLADAEAVADAHVAKHGGPTTVASLVDIVTPPCTEEAP